MNFCQAEMSLYPQHQRFVVAPITPLDWAGDYQGPQPTSAFSPLLGEMYYDPESDLYLPLCLETLLGVDNDNTNTSLTWGSVCGTYQCNLCPPPPFNTGWGESTIEKINDSSQLQEGTVTQNHKSDLQTGSINEGRSGSPVVEQPAQHQVISLSPYEEPVPSIRAQGKKRKLIVSQEKADTGKKADTGDRAVGGDVRLPVVEPTPEEEMLRQWVRENRGGKVLDALTSPSRKKFKEEEEEEEGEEEENAKKRQKNDIDNTSLRGTVSIDDVRKDRKEALKAATNSKRRPPKIIRNSAPEEGRPKLVTLDGTSVISSYDYM